ncbi:MAG: hypothetical protein M3271_08500 [Actinomycetota bacterium]|nr:hypothetical protein [Actinomycetota bacterium]
MTTVLSGVRWLEGPLRVDLEEIMDELDPGWSVWTGDEVRRDHGADR